MKKRPPIPRVDALGDEEMGLLLELRILNEGGVLGPVLDAIASGLEALYLEGERQALERKQREVRERAGKPGAPTAFGSAMRKAADTPSQFTLKTPRYSTALLEKTASGMWLMRLDYKRRKEIQEVMRAEIGAKAKQAGMNSCRAYVGSTM